jgi:hypothetical protein
MIVSYIKTLLIFSLLLNLKKNCLFIFITVLRYKNVRSDSLFLTRA